ncbi:MAG: undecaprenyldiphospho-muramoylpentapeptide beta-N-acetylglucosaminyltransferase [Ignavibacterium sp.]
MKKNNYKFLFAGGGTAGHLFPLLAVAEKILELKPESDLLFIGTKEKIEGRIVPQLGYKFNSIWIKGFSRKMNLDNLLFPLKLIVSVIQSIGINMKFKPKVAIGGGGYVAGPAIFGASVMGAKILLIEQNSYPGITTRLLEKYADEIHLSYEDSKKYFRKKNKLFITGNPIRLKQQFIDKKEASKYFGLDSEKKTLLIIGGSLGAKSINEAIANSLLKLNENDIQIIWQTGNKYFEQYKNMKNELSFVSPFIDKMDLAYSASDLLIARAGATTIAEITSLGIASILVPSPNVAENHQYYNAKSLEENNAAVMIKDNELWESSGIAIPSGKNKLYETVLSLINNEEKLNQLKNNAKKFGKPDAAEIIAKRAIDLAKK